MEKGDCDMAALLPLTDGEAGEGAPIEEIRGRVGAGGVAIVRTLGARSRVSVE
jgi:hypothetical protein